MPFAALFVDTRLATPAEALRRLAGLRWLSVATMVVAVAAAPALLGLPLPRKTLLAIAAAHAIFNLAVSLRARTVRPVSAPVIFSHLCVDLAAWSAFVYFTGGATNPLISLLLPLVAIGAAVLPAAWAWTLALLAIAAYSLLWSFNQHLHIHDEDMAVHWHLAGMWATFALSAVVMVTYIVKMMATIRDRDEALAQVREAQLRNERIVALGNLAAGAAHELGTPLATMAVVAGELVRDPGLSGDNRADVELLREQLAHCKAILGNLTLRAGSLRAEGGEIVPACQWLTGVIDHWRSMRPHVSAAVAINCGCGSDSPPIVADATLEQAVHNVINNAADVSPEDIAIEAQVRGESLEVTVADRGPGVPVEILDRAGLESVASHSDGLGIGLLLAFSAVERCGGEITFRGRPGGGTIATLTLPLSALSPA